jgi:2'-5' RNA ligase
MSKTRRQLTLFVEEKDAETIEKIRAKYNPEQYQLIKSHVTLCREDELEPFENILHNLTNLTHSYISIEFGSVSRFSEGKGVLIPSNGDNETFQNVRKLVLQGLTDNPKKHEPHITLMHPGNSTCTDRIFEQLKKTVFPIKLEFRKISVIEQVDGKPWIVLKEFELKASFNN